MKLRPHKFIEDYINFALALVKKATTLLYYSYRAGITFKYSDVFDLEDQSVRMQVNFHRVRIPAAFYQEEVGVEFICGPIEGANDSSKHSHKKALLKFGSLWNSAIY